MTSVSGRQSGLYPNILWLALCLGLIICAVNAFSQEYRSAVMVRSLDLDVITQLQDIDLDALPVTPAGLGELMTKCADLLLASTVLRLNATLAGDVAQSCAAAAERALERNPGFARAHAAGLVARAVSYDAADYAAAIPTAPFEPWPLGTRLLSAERRVVLGGTLSPDLAALVSEDAARAAQSGTGRQLLAGIYLRRPALQPLIVAAVETRPEAEQAAFLRALRSVMDR